MAGAQRRDQKPMGINLAVDVHAEAERLARVTPLSKSDVLRLAIAAGLPIVARQLAGEDGEAA